MIVLRVILFKSFVVALLVSFVQLKVKLTVELIKEQRQWTTSEEVPDAIIFPHDAYVISL